jgi:hypothetical protein
MKAIQSVKKAIAIFLASWGVVACVPSCQDSKVASPEERLHKYISTAVNITVLDQKQELAELTSGSLKESILNATESVFKKAYLEKRYEFKSFEIVNRVEVAGKKQVALDYKMVYRSWIAGEVQERAPLQEIVNRANMIYENGQWVISRVENLNQSLEWEVGMSLDGVSTEGVTPESDPVEVQSSREISGEQLKEDQEQAMPSSSAPENASPGQTTTEPK